MEILGGGLILAGFVCYVIGTVWMAIRAFQTSVFWGLAVLFVPFAAPAYLFKCWSSARRPFCFTLTGWALFLIGGYIYQCAVSSMR